MSTELDELTADLQTYLVSPLNAFGLGGFVFDIEGESTTKLVAEITDHYTEDNKAVQDHIARKPKTITLRGYVGEVVYRPGGSGGIGSIVQTVTQKLTQLTAFLPTVSAATAQLQGVVSDQTIGFSQGISDAADIYGLVKNIIGSTGDTANQQQAFRYFSACWEQGILMGIQTPWEFLTNMAIESVTAIQDEKTKYMTDFSVTYKQMRFAKTISGAYNGSPQSQAMSDNAAANAGTVATPAPIIPVETQNLDGTPVLQGAAALQAPDPVTIGAVSGVGLPSSLLNGAQQYISQASDMLTNPSIAAIFKQAGAQ